MAEVVSFLSEHSGGSSCVQVDLGCNGYKLSCTFGEASSNPDKQLHYVVAPRLLSSAVDGDEYGVDGWTEKIMESFGDMTTFSPFMHEKAQVFVNDIVAKLAPKGVAPGVALGRFDSELSDALIVTQEGKEASRCIDEADTVGEGCALKRC